MTDESRELLSGTLEMLVLKTLALEPMHGWGIAHRIEQMSSSVFFVAQGSLYPALLRMNAAAGSKPAGKPPRTIAEPATTSSRRRDRSSSTPNARPGTAPPAPSTPS